MRIAIACGGTGGHIFPGLAVGRVLQGRGHEVTLWLAGRSVERTSLPDWSGAVEVIPSMGLSGGPLRRALALGRCSMAIVRAFGRMRRARPEVVLAMGSYASVAPVMAARALKIPIVLHEANAVPGRAIQRLSRWARIVAVSFDEASSRFPGVATVRVGFPLRSELVARAGAARPAPDRFTVLVTGGSQGAHWLNTTVSQALCQAARGDLRLRVIHLSGPHDAEAVRATYKQAGIDAEVHGFLSDMASAYERASVAICRAGAATCAELALFGIPALFVPLPSAARDHQYANAHAFAERGAADVVRQTDLSTERLLGYIQSYAGATGRLRSMADAMRATGDPTAAERLAELVASQTT